MGLILFPLAVASMTDGDLSDWSLSGLNTGDWPENKDGFRLKAGLLSLKIMQIPDHHLNIGFIYIRHS